MTPRFKAGNAVSRNCDEEKKIKTKKGRDLNENRKAVFISLQVLKQMKVSVSQLYCK